MLHVTAILGDAADPRFAAQRVETVCVTAADASKPRLRLESDAGSDVAIQLERGSFLWEGAVLHDDGERIVVVEREAEPTLVVRLDPGLDRDETVRHAARIAHAFGNQHVPIEIVGGELRVPITTSEEIARATVQRLRLPGAEVTIAAIKLACISPLAAGVEHGHGSSR